MSAGRVVVLTTATTAAERGRRRMLLIVNRYYAKPGMADAVLQTRRRMDALLRRLHLPAGQTFVRHRRPDGAPDARALRYTVREDGTRDELRDPPDRPDVIWQCLAESRDALERWAHALSSDPGASAEADAIVAEQRTQVARFDREYYDLDASSATVNGDAAALE